MSFYPKWQKSGSEATISWDVSGYYHYLPAIFIYKDLKGLSFQEDILQRYRPTPERQQAFPHSSGSYVMKYSCGQAVQMLPFFMIGHAYASYSNQYKSDGYSLPYQLSISIGALIIALIGLLVWRKFLLFHFNDLTVALTILLIGLGSNYFEYAGITGAMTHNNLFTLYAILLLLSHRFYKKPSYGIAILIGSCIGLMALTRPTELIAVFIPILYGIHPLMESDRHARIQFFKKHFYKMIAATVVCGMIGFIQLVYWKYVSGDWIVYSYEEQGFSWLSPHIYNGLLSYNNGWLRYSPMMIVSVIGLLLIPKFRKGKFLFSILYFLLFIYIAFAWDIWWYGGSLGQRTMVQIYPVLSIPFALAVRKVVRSNISFKVLFSILSLIFIYINFWFTYQAHKGKMLHVEQMTKAYYWHTVGKWTYQEEDTKLLDNKDVYFNFIEENKIKPIGLSMATDGDKSCFRGEIIIISTLCEYSPIYNVDSSPHNKKWLRLYADITTERKEWNVWQMPQMIIKYHNADGLQVKYNMIKMQRFLMPGIKETIYLDSKIPKEDNLTVTVLFWNVGSQGETMIENVRMIAF